MPEIKSTNAYSERVLFEGERVSIPVVDVEFADGRFKRYRTMPDGSLQIEESYLRSCVAFLGLI